MAWLNFFIILDQCFQCGKSYKWDARIPFPIRGFLYLTLMFLFRKIRFLWILRSLTRKKYLEVDAKYQKPQNPEHPGTEFFSPKSLLIQSILIKNIIFNRYLWKFFTIFSGVCTPLLPEPNLLSLKPPPYQNTLVFIWFTLAFHIGSALQFTTLRSCKIPSKLTFKKCWNISKNRPTHYHKHYLRQRDTFGSVYLIIFNNWPF